MSWTYMRNQRTYDQLTDAKLIAGAAITLIVLLFIWRLHQENEHAEFSFTTLTLLARGPAPQITFDVSVMKPTKLQLPVSHFGWSVFCY